jgi:3-oxocholest-4-en-26-oyl-CoA dehydrogenase alpha subunit
VQLKLAKMTARLEFLKLANWEAAWSATYAQLNPSLASSIKVFGTEFYMECLRELMEIVGPSAYLTPESPGAVLASSLQRSYRGMLILTFGGGVNEVQRDLIAIFGLGMPRADR